MIYFLIYILDYDILLLLMIIFRNLTSILRKGLGSYSSFLLPKTPFFFLTQEVTIWQRDTVSTLQSDAAESEPWRGLYRLLLDLGSYWSLCALLSWPGKWGEWKLSFSVALRIGCSERTAWTSTKHRVSQLAARSARAIQGQEKQMQRDSWYSLSHQGVNLGVMVQPEGIPALPGIPCCPVLTLP